MTLAQQYTQLYHSPLQLNLRSQTRLFLDSLSIQPEELPTVSPFNFLPIEALQILFNCGYPKFQQHEDVQPRQLLLVLSELLAIQPLSTRIVDFYRPILMPIMGVWISEPYSSWEKWALRVVIGISISEAVEEVWPVVSRLLTLSPAGASPLGQLNQLSPQTLHPLLISSLRLFSIRPSIEPSEILPFFSLPDLHELFVGPAYHPDIATRMLATRIYAGVLEIGEAVRIGWENETAKLSGEENTRSYRWFEGLQLAHSESEFNQELQVVEYWTLSDIWAVQEQERLSNFSKGLPLINAMYNFTSEEDSLYLLNINDVPCCIALVSTIFLLRSNLKDAEILLSQHIPTPTSSKTLQSLALNLSARLPTLLTAPPSSGKTHLLTHLHSHLFSSSTQGILNISLADTSIDPKSLLGNYVSDPKEPGKFIWVQGALARAMSEGRWVVLEDVDKASGEMLALISTISGLMGPTKRIGQRPVLQMLGRPDVVAGDGFALFATRTVSPTVIEPVDIISGNELVFPPAHFFGNLKFFEVVLPAPSTEEIQLILESKFPRLQGPFSRTLLSVWSTAKAGTSGSTASKVKGREFGLRDLIKLFSRVSSLIASSSVEGVWDDQGKLINPIVQEEIFEEARDIFVGSSPTQVSSHYSQVELDLALALGLSKERYEWALTKRRPVFQITGGEDGGASTGLQVGRVRLASKPTRHQSLSPTRPFALTRPSLILLERLAAAIQLSEPLLLVGETGTGKTTAVQHLATTLRRPLIALNLSTQTESSDILGGFKPLDPKVPAGELLVQFGDLFGKTFSKKRNQQFSNAIRNAVLQSKWKNCVKMWTDAGSLAKQEVEKKRQKEIEAVADSSVDVERIRAEGEPSSPRKRRKLNSEGSKWDVLAVAWDQFLSNVAEFDIQHARGGGRFVFSYVEGPLVRALRRGDWILLDEVNLASPETLESLTSILEGPESSVVLTERGDLEPIPRHPDFRLFACMNPATDVGKKDLPPTLRARFTEIYVPPPDNDPEALIAIVKQYIGDAAVADRPAIMDVAELYSSTKALADTREIADGSNQPPHYSMRTLARALTFASDVTPIYGLRRSLWEGFMMSFSMSLEASSASLVRQLAERHILGRAGNPNAILNQMPAVPPGRSEDELIRFGQFWLQRGPLEAQLVDEYVLTPSVQAKLFDLARVISTNRFPVLIQGPTSSGKTSAVEYLAKRTGHRFVRINNHEHTDIQEYLGTYVSDSNSGKLVFQEGVLVRAVRQGDWLVLDELNLAPTDVLEALNRLLDDNRELVLPETQEVIRPHPHFMLFATQNPPGLYGGRKVLSRAFRNRFLEVHFDDVPQAELETIICQRCHIPPSYAKRIVSVFQELQKRRQAGRVFETKQSFATLRDLFRWAGRQSEDVQQLANHGYMLLAERSRRGDDKAVVKDVIEATLKVQVDERSLYNLESLTHAEVFTKLGCTLPPSTSNSLVWTSAMQRLYTLIATATKYNEPVLLVGETGCGKTSVCEMLSEATGRKLTSVNCHQNMETSDLLGGQRPLRNRSKIQAEQINGLNEFFGQTGIPAPYDTSAEISEILVRTDKFIQQNEHSLDALHLSQLKSRLQLLRRASALFEWQDGPLVEAMQSGGLLLLDEVSLADDSVLERLNSVLEPGRTLVLAEKGGSEIADITLVGSPGFQILATMNPGGDYGKKELSPALRNRFTEIWVPSIDNRDDLVKIVNSSWRHSALASYTELLLDFVKWFSALLGDSSNPVVGLRDILAWVQFSNIAMENLNMSPNQVFRHAAHLTFIDGIGALPQAAGLSTQSLVQLHDSCVSQLDLILGQADSIPGFERQIQDSTSHFAIGGFGMMKGAAPMKSSLFSLQAPTTSDNAMRVLRGCQLHKPILLEGSPGVGKTSLVTALAAATQNTLCRINLSDQTDLADLFGSDLPVEGGKPGEFAWKDAAFLSALQNGDWVLLDEMNLASQAVLEGLNAVLDHRGTVYLPELGRSFVRHPNFRIFAAQNPTAQGGGRKGLPKSFLNRFTKVYVQELSAEDMQIICSHLYPSLSPTTLLSMIQFNSKLHSETMVKRNIGRDGSPWEFNLRDVLRWLAVLQRLSGLELQDGHPVEFLRMIYLRRFRNVEDRQSVLDLFQSVFKCSLDLEDRPWPSITTTHVQFGHSIIPRGSLQKQSTSVTVLQSHLPSLEAIAKTIELGWLVILCGASGVGKTSVLRCVAELSGRRLREFSMNSGVDTMELLGSFEQADFTRRASKIVNRLKALARGGLAALTFTRETWLEVEHTVSRLEKSLAHTSEEHQAQFADSCQAILNRLADLLDPNSLSEVTSLAAAIKDVSLSQGTSGRFEWVDGILVEAMVAGDWLVIDNANLCNASVLDRINSLCETDGVLTLSERGAVNGTVQVLKPHPQFRLFMTLDPRHGELSRAMRNRGIEIVVDNVASPQDIKRISYLHRRITPSPFTCAALRRGISISESIIEPIDPSHIPSITLDTPLTALLPHLSQVRMAAASKYLQSSFIQHYISATSITHLPYTLHLAHESFLATHHWLLPGFIAAAAGITSCSLDSYSNGLKAVLEVKKSLPKEFLSDQPLELSSNPNLYRPVVQEHFFAPKVVQLATRFKISMGWLNDRLLPAHKRSENLLTIIEKSYLLSKGVKMRRPVQPGVESVYPLFEALEQCVTAVIRQLTVNASQERSEITRWLSTLSYLMDVTDELEAICEVADYDFSAIQVVCEWIYLSLKSLPSLFAEIHPHLQLLADSISLTTGKGQREIWVGYLVLYNSNSSSVMGFGKAIEAYAWLEATAKAEEHIQYELTGAANTFRPLTSEELLRTNDQNVLKLKDLHSHDSAIRRISSDIYTHSQPSWHSGTERSTVALHGVLTHVICSFYESFEPKFDSMLGAWNAFEVTTSASSLSGLVLSSSHQALKDSFTQRVLEFLPILESDPITSNLDLHLLGRAWLAAALFEMQLYVTDVPIDPAVAQHRESLLLSHQKERMLSEIQVNMVAEQNVTGKSSNEHIRQISLELNNILENQSKLETTLVTRDTNLPLLNSFFHELKLFLSNVLEENNLATLSLAFSVATVDNQPYLRENTIQQSIDGFIHRAQQTYGHFGDLLRPVIAALHQAQVGIRTMARSSQLKSAFASAKHEVELVQVITSFPTPFAVQRLHHSQLPFRLKSSTPAVSTTALLLLAATGVAYDVSIGIDLAPMVPALAGIFDQIVGLWIIDREKAAQAEQEAESLYRQRKTEETILSDLELEEKEFKQLFPQFGDIMDEEDSSNLADNSNSLAAAAASSFVKSEDITSMYRLHVALFDSQNSRIDFRRNFHSKRENVVRSTLMRHPDAFSDDLDINTIAFQVQLLSDGKDRTSNSPQPDGRPFDFYSDGNPFEMRKAVALIDNLKARLSLLIEEWPEQMVLQHLMDRCEAIMSMSLSSAIVKVIAALEQLLLQTEDWEAYANRDNTLKTFQHDIAGLIVEWRRLELSSWSQLLETQAVRFSEEVAVYWARFFEVLVLGSRSATTTASEESESALDSYLNEAISLLDQFLLTSPLGQFSARLGLLRSFASFLTILSTTSLSFNGLARVATAVKSISNRYRLVEEKVATNLQSQRSKLESEIRDFIKLASWKDINVHALKASAQRTHKHLHRCVRKFRDILRQPCGNALVAVDGASINRLDVTALIYNLPTANKNPDALLNPPPYRYESALHLNALSATFLKYQSLYNVTIRPNLSKTFSDALEDLSSSIISTSKELAEATPSVSSEENKRTIKSLLTRKRKAWSDLLKELKRIGLSTNIRPEVLAHQQSQMRMHSLEEISLPSLPPSLVSLAAKVEDYHFRLMVVLPVLRSSLSSHHSDVSTRELQKGVGFVESLLSVALGSRARLATVIEQYKELHSISVRFSALDTKDKASDGKLTYGSQVATCQTNAQKMMAIILESLKEVSRNRTAYLVHIGQASSTAYLDDLLSEAEELNSGLLSDVKFLSNNLDSHVVSISEILRLQSCENFIDRLTQRLQELSSAHSSLRHLYVDFYSSIKDWRLEPIIALLEQPSDEEVLWRRSDRLINSLLVIAQDLRTKCTPISTPSAADASEGSEDVPDLFVTSESTRLISNNQLLRVGDILSQLHSILSDTRSPSSIVNRVLSRLSPFLVEYTSAVTDHIEAELHWSKAIFKITYVMNTTISSLVEKGFCTPPEADQSSGEGESGQTQSGTGMGAGTGNENVSNEIEEEGQVEGLQDEKTEPQPKDQKKEEGGAIEMSEDFGGDLEDVSGDESEDGDEDSDEDDSPPDEQIGDVDPLDENAVDEKLWGDDQTAEGDKSDEKLDEDRSKEQSKQSEMVAKDSNKENKSDGKKQEEQSTTEEGDDENAPEGEEDGDPEAFNEEEEDGDRGQGEKMDQHVPEADTLDLPDELDIKDDGDGSDAEMDDLEDEALGDSEELPMPDSNDGPSQQSKSQEEDEPAPETMDEEEETGIPDSTVPDEGVQEPEGEGEDATAEAGEEDVEMNGDDEDPDSHAAKPDLNAGIGESQNEEADNQAPQTSDSTMDEAGGTQDQTGSQVQKTTAQNEDEKGQLSEDHSDMPPPDSLDSSAVQGKAVPLASSTEDQPSQSKQLEEDQSRQLGDSSKEVQRRPDAILDPEDTAQDPPANSADAIDPSEQVGDVEYLQEDDDEAMQALGAAPEDQMQKLSDLRIGDELEESQQVAEEREGETIPEEPNQEQLFEIQPASRSAPSEKALTESQVRERGLQQLPNLDDLRLKPNYEPAPMSETEVQQLNHEVEIKLQEWNESNRTSISAEKLWRLYTSLTRDLSHSLCEQLRLILEPTLATRLKGDYRTGKRLNMKKIVPYVASEFTKDKIWLRRTRPSSREYQILIALDDSRSMAESHSVHLAYETLSLVSQAMTKLEVGDISIAKFGQHVEVLHSFEEGTLSDDKGARVMSQFQFRQKATNVLSLVETSLRVLSEARQRRSATSSTAGDLWQLELIVSDGICQDHDRLRALLRQAAEQRVMIVFIIVDSLHSSNNNPSSTSSQPEIPQKNSILSMKTAKYDMGPNGLMELTMERYLDTFPFDFYVVLRDVEALPEVLSSTLRQWMERVSSDA